MGRLPSHSTVPVSNSTDDVFQLDFSPSKLQQRIQQLLVPANHNIGPVIWEDSESDVIVHVDTLRFAIKPGLALFEIHLEADGIGLVPMIVPFTIGRNVTSASLVISTEHLPRGEQIMTHRWGEIVQEHLWYALLEAGEQLKNDQLKNIQDKNQAAQTQAIQISGIYSDGKSISYLYSEPVSVEEIKVYAKAINDGLIPPRNDNVSLSPVHLDCSSEPPASNDEDTCKTQPPTPQDPLPVLIQLWREWLALIRQTLRFTKKLAWVVVQLSKNIKKK